MNNITKEVIEWTKNYFNETHATKAVIGISGGKDSSVSAAICTAALGKENVIGVEMPNGVQHDIDCSEKLINHLGINKRIININTAFNSILAQVDETPNYNAKVNLPARLRMSALYAVAQHENARVCNTCNLSEDTVGYATLYGDSAGDFSPISRLTTEEIIFIGDDLGLPHELTHKVPIDGLQPLSDEEKLGFTYHEVNELVRNGIKGEHFDKIIDMYKRNKFKTEIIQIPAYIPFLPNHINEFI